MTSFFNNKQCDIKTVRANLSNIYFSNMKQHLGYSVAFVTWDKGEAMAQSQGIYVYNIPHDHGIFNCLKARYSTVDKDEYWCYGLNNQNSHKMITGDRHRALHFKPCNIVCTYNGKYVEIYMYDRYCAYQVERVTSLVCTAEILIKEVFVKVIELFVKMAYWWQLHWKKGDKFSRQLGLWYSRSTILWYSYRNTAFTQSKLIWSAAPFEYYIY